MAAHSLAAAWLAALPLSGPARFALLAGCAISAYYTFRRLIAQPLGLKLDPDGGWQLQLADRVPGVTARLTGGQRLPGLLYLQWRADGRDCAALLWGREEALRRLRARLRLDREDGDEPSR